MKLSEHRIGCIGGFTTGRVQRCQPRKLRSKRREFEIGYRPVVGILLTAGRNKVLR